MYQIIGLFVAVIVLLLAGWGAVTSLKGELDTKIDSVSNSLHSEIQNITLEVGKVIGRAETGVNA